MSTWTPEGSLGWHFGSFRPSFLLAEGLEGGTVPGIFVIIFVCSELGRKNLNHFGKQSSDVTSALRIGWQEVAESSAMGLAMCLFCLF